MTNPLPVGKPELRAKKLTPRPRDKIFRAIRRLRRSKPLGPEVEVDHARNTILEVGRKKQEAQEFLETCDSRRKLSKNHPNRLEDSSYEAEVTKAQTIIKLCDLLEDMYEKAKSSNDAESLLRIGLTARYLTVNVERSGLLSAERYQPGELGEFVAKAMIAKSQRLYSIIHDMLNGTPERLGTHFPEF